MKLISALTLLVIAFSCAYADPPDPVPVLLFDKNCELYEMQQNLMLKTAGACVENLVGSKVKK